MSNAPENVLLLAKDGSHRPVDADAVRQVHQTLLKRAEEWHKSGGSFPLPDHVIHSIPLLPELIDSVGVERDLPHKFPNLPAAPILASIRLLVERAPCEISKDEEGEYMMLPGLCGPIRICFVTPESRR